MKISDSKLIPRDSKNKIFYLFFSLLIFALIFTFIFSDSIYIYINPVKDDVNNIVRFADWRIIVDSNICYREMLDVYSINPCDSSNRRFIYGKALLFLPNPEGNYFFYTIVFPLISIFLFIISVTIILSPKSKQDYFILSLLLLSSPLILGIERFNPEIVIFLTLLLISFYRSSIIIHFLIFIISNIKFYPAMAGLIFLSEKLKIKNYFNIFFLLIIFTFIFYFNFEELKKIDTYRDGITSTVENVGIFIFSYYSLPDLFRLISIHLELFNPELLYDITKILTILLVLTGSYIVLNTCKKKKIFLDISLSKFEDRLFLLSTVFLLVLYFLKFNYLYVEIYFLGLLPFLKKKVEINNLYKFFYFLIIFKLILMSVLCLIQNIFFENSIFLKGFNILCKNIIDVSLIIILLSFMISYLLKVMSNFRVQN